MNGKVNSANEMDRSDISSSSADESKNPVKNETRNKRHWKKTEMAKEKKKPGLPKAVPVKASATRRAPSGQVASNATTDPPAAASTPTSAASLSSSRSSSTSSLANSSVTSESSAVTEPAVDNLASAVTDVILQDDFDLDNLIASLPREWILVLFCFACSVLFGSCFVLFYLFSDYCPLYDLQYFDAFLPFFLRGRSL